MDTGEHGKFSNVTIHFAGCDHFVDLAEHCFHIRFRFVLGKFREQRRRRLGDAAARTGETDVLDFLAVHREKKLQLIATNRIAPLRGTGRLRHLVEIPRLLAVVKNDLLIKIVQVFKHGIISSP